jgi:hypothetical protein
MKKLFIFILSFPLLTSFGQSVNSFCAFNQNGEKYELNLVDGTGSLTFVQYNRSGVIVKTVSGTWAMRDEGVYGPFERLTVNIPVGQMKFLVVRTSRGAIQELRDESPYKRNFQPCTGILSDGNNQTEKIIDYNPNASKIIGTPIRIDNLEVAQYDFPQQLTWDDAKKTCDLLGDGWRLPTKYELNDLFQNKIKIGNFKRADYWSSTEKDFYLSWSQDFNDGSESYFYKSSKKVSGIVISPKAFYVRAVKTFIPAKKSTSISIIGAAITLGNFELTEFDFPDRMDWDGAKAACSKLGKGWRLPTKDELNIINQYYVKKGGFEPYGYWSSTECSINEVWGQFFIGGGGRQDCYDKKIYKLNFRAVKTMNTRVSANENIGATSDKQIVIGTPIKIGNLEVAQFDFAQKMNCDEAKAACDKIGEGWRLPTKVELNILYHNRSKIGGFETYASYWSSTEGKTLGNTKQAWIQSFISDFQDVFSVNNNFNVRAVRSF